MRMSTRPLLFRISLLTMMLFAIVPTFAVAQDVVDAGAPDELLADFGKVAQTATTLEHTGVAGTLALIVASLVLVTRLLTRFGKLLPGVVGAWFATPRATWVLPMVLSIGGALLSALTSGAPISLGLFIGAVVAGLAGGGIGSVPAKMEQQKKAAAAGDAAAAKVVTNDDVLDVLTNGAKGSAGVMTAREVTQLAAMYVAMTCIAWISADPVTGLVALAFIVFSTIKVWRGFRA